MVPCQLHHMASFSRIELDSIRSDRFIRGMIRSVPILTPMNRFLWRIPNIHARMGMFHSNLFDCIVNRIPQILQQRSYYFDMLAFGCT